MKSIHTAVNIMSNSWRNMAQTEDLHAPKTYVGKNLKFKMCKVKSMYSFCTLTDSDTIKYYKDVTLKC